VWVVSRGDNKVTELDAATGALVQVFASTSYGLGEPTAVSSDGTDVWVANQGYNSVTGFPASSG
jgi:DNA-binding beta-propeller fold protein YncE